VFISGYSWFSYNVVIIQNKKIINPSVVLVSSDVRPSNNFKPDRVPHLKDCALRDIKMLDRRGSRVGQKMNYCSSFC